MTKIIKINTKPKVIKLKIGDIVKFDNRNPVKVVKKVSGGCDNCCMFNSRCDNLWEYCGDKFMFEKVKND